MKSVSTIGLPRTQALILAGGRGERLSPLTESRPKPAIPFGGLFRIVDFTLSNCLNSKLRQVAVLTQYRHDELQSYIRHRWNGCWNTAAQGNQQLVCLPPRSGNEYRGTADAVFQNLGLIESNRPDYVIILSGDHVYQMDYRELVSQHLETNADVTISTIEHAVKDASHFGVVEVNDDFRVTGFKEKPLKARGLPSRPNMALISMGVYVFKTNVLVRTLTENCNQGSGFDFGHHVIPSLIGGARVYAYDFRDQVQNAPPYWRDIGTIDSYYEASMDLVRRELGSFSPCTNGQWHSRSAVAMRPSATVCAGAHVSRSVLSPGVYISQDAFVQDSVLMPGVRVGRGARIRRAIIDEGVQIPRNFRAGWNVEQDRNLYTVSASGVVVVSKTPKLVRLRAKAAKRTGGVNVSVESRSVRCAS